MDERAFKDSEAEWGGGKKRSFFPLGSKYQGEKNMPLEFTFKTTNLCFLSQTHHTPGTSSYQILTFSRSFHDREGEGFSSSLLGWKEVKIKGKKKKGNCSLDEKEELSEDQTSLVVSPKQVAPVT